jgi:GTPase
MQNGLPVIVLVGRPNVGKSTLFNRLTGTRDALVADLPGLTRDRQYGTGEHEGKAFVVVDTGGLMPESKDPLAALAEDQAKVALDEADHVLFLVDMQKGRTGSDESIARFLRKLGKPLTLCVNKAEGAVKASANTEFYKLGLGEPFPISAEHGHGLTPLLVHVLKDLPAAVLPDEKDDSIRVAIVGRPNVGKSTLVNRLFGEARVLAADLPGTTRDAIYVPFEYDGRKYTFIDTAGVRRKARVWETVEKFSIVKTLQAIESAHVVIAVNKWDGLDAGRREWIRSEVDFKLPFLDYAPLHFISALHGSGLGELMDDVQDAYASTMIDLPTPELNRVLERAVQSHQPPARLGRRVKLRYAHQGGQNPPKIVIHGNQTEILPVSYKRYLTNQFREHFKLKGVPLVLSFKTGDNPFKGRPNPLSNWQIRKKRRLMARVKR